ncbi:MAG: hypothetical protein Q7R79_01540 [bacterium]|nr:hypothetical protein [bacterium]
MMKNKGGSSDYLAIYWTIPQLSTTPKKEELEKLAFCIRENFPTVNNISIVAELSMLVVRLPGGNHRELSRKIEETCHCRMHWDHCRHSKEPK